MCFIHDDEIYKLRKRLKDLEKENEKEFLKKRIRELERNMPWTKQSPVITNRPPIIPPSFPLVNIQDILSPSSPSITIDDEIDIINKKSKK